MQNPSLENISTSSLKNFLIKLGIANKYAKKGFAANNLELENTDEKELRCRIQQLEKELQQTKEERDKALEENRTKINELNNELTSVKTMMKDLLQAKKKRIMHLERKVRERVD